MISVVAIIVVLFDVIAVIVIAGSYITNRPARSILPHARHHHKIIIVKRVLCFFLLSLHLILSLSPPPPGAIREAEVVAVLNFWHK